MALHHEVHGTAKPGAPSLLLISGLGGSTAFWKPQIHALVEAGWRVVVYDQRGTGRSPAALAAGYSIAAMAADACEVLDATDTVRSVVVGHALGGLVGLQMALDVPARVEGLVLINAWSRPNPHSQRCFNARLSLLAASGPRAYVEAQPIFLYPASWCTEHAEAVQAEVDHALAYFPGEANMRARIGALSRFDRDAELHAIRVPALVSTAMDDVLVPWTMSQRLAEKLPRATLDCVAHGGHAHSVTDAPTFNRRLLNFLEVQLNQLATP